MRYFTGGDMVSIYVRICDNGHVEDLCYNIYDKNICEV